MCRAMVYLGLQESLVHDLLYGSDNSLVCQSYAPKLMSGIQNLAGLGFCAWSKTTHDPSRPFLYKTTQLPFFDKNLFNMSQKITTTCMLAHVRGVSYEIKETISDENVHPFKLNETQIAFAHNGNLVRMAEMKYPLAKFIKPHLFGKITGTTDSEWMYMLFLSQFNDYTADIPLDEASHALINTLKIIRQVRIECGIEASSPVNLFITNGSYLLVTRFVFDYCRNLQEEDAIVNYKSLWLTVGESCTITDGVYKMQGTGVRRNILFASEPLSNDRTCWIELPEYSLTQAWLENNQVSFRTFDLVV